MTELPLATRLVVFFTRNPDESLRKTDIHKKFGTGIPKRSVAKSIDYAVYQGLIERDPSDRQVAWRTGPALRGELQQ